MVKLIKKSAIEYLHIWRRQAVPGKLLILCAISLFLPFFLVSVPFFITVGYAVFNEEARRAVLRVKHGWLFAVFALIGTITALFSANWFGALGGVFLICLCIFSLFARAFMTRNLFNVTTGMMCRLGVLSFFVGALDFFIRFSSHSEHRTSSTFFNPNYYGFVIEILVLLCLFKLQTEPYRWRIYLTLATINSLGLFFCKTRSAIPALLLGTLVFFIFSKNYRSLGICTALIVILAAGMIFSPNDFILRYDSLAFSVSDRISIWKTAVSGLGISPIFGQGLWAYVKVYNLNGGTWAINSHNIVLDFLLSFGVVGSIAILVYFIAVFIGLKRQVHINAFYHEYSIIIAIFFCAFAHCMTDLAIIGVQPPIMAMLLFGIVGDGRKVETGNLKKRL